ncbi:1-acyl-sn-glycerol-3-phosphate acyltransferase [Hoyosella sp. YIM 151337]|uniref:lysophospholipid acyltransferase family protein n=1 Tax=Hoyosella sp. YIM 151337 TaxID=2992742 RepID=UPI002235C13A|nr:lysophospholipid acyltransferase family protein [Hoyosella sp. YIM 151337]MCW4354634.1 1-acyl-sn-glycerol-3-phosphate acyltransferase [Hoyosella sp. YIM 151337]
MELVYGPVVAFAKSLFRFQGLDFTVTGSENMPEKGGAVIALNHTGYLDFAYAGWAMLPAKRYIRYMAKKEVFDNRITGPIMRGCKHIPVDRVEGAGAYQAAVRALQDGELVGVYPEATISRSFELKEFKSGAARMSIEAGVPIIPIVVWGAQRVWTKGHPKRLGRTKTPILVSVGKPIEPFEPAAELTAQLKTVMQEMLLEAQEQYGPHPEGEYWVPKRLGGSAPSLEEATEMDRRDAEARLAARKARDEAGQQ